MATFLDPSACRRQPGVAPNSGMPERWIDAAKTAFGMSSRDITAAVVECSSASTNDSHGPGSRIPWSHKPLSSSRDAGFGVFETQSLGDLDPAQRRDVLLCWRVIHRVVGAAYFQNPPSRASAFASERSLAGIVASPPRCAMWHKG
jgi:hypothetical protein